MFTPAIDRRIKRSIVGGLSLVAVAAVAFYFGRHPSVMDEGYRPVQPVPFDHSVHAGTLHIACVYCHTSVERSAHSTVPPTATCMNCHSIVKRDSPRLALVRASYEKNVALQW